MDKGTGKVFHVHSKKVCTGRRGITTLILNESLDGGECSTTHPGRFSAVNELP